jgi:hypothetical protein
VGRWHKVFTPDRRQQGQHLAVQHFPGADLLLDHVKAGLFDVHLGRVLEKESLKECKEF